MITLGTVTVPNFDGDNALFWGYAGVRTVKGR